MRTEGRFGGVLGRLAQAGPCRQSEAGFLGCLQTGEMKGFEVCRQLGVPVGGRERRWGWHPGGGSGTGIWGMFDFEVGAHC